MDSQNRRRRSEVPTGKWSGELLSRMFEEAAVWIKAHPLSNPPPDGPTKDLRRFFEEVRRRHRAGQLIDGIRLPLTQIGFAFKAYHNPRARSIDEVCEAAQRYFEACQSWPDAKCKEPVWLGKYLANAVGTIRQSGGLTPALNELARRLPELTIMAPWGEPVKIAVINRSGKNDATTEGTRFRNNLKNAAAFICCARRLPDRQSANRAEATSATWLRNTLIRYSSGRLSPSGRILLQQELFVHWPEDELVCWAILTRRHLALARRSAPVAPGSLTRTLAATSGPASAHRGL